MLLASIVARVMSPTLLSDSDVKPRVERVTSDDDLFIRMDRALGVPLANQVIWRLGTPIDAERLVKIGERLSSTPFNRRLRRTSFPLARDYWIPAGPTGGTVVYDTETIDEDDLNSWLHACVSAEFDLERGPVWCLRAARLTNGGGVVSLTCSHAVADGWSGSRAVTSSVDQSGAAPDRFPVRAASSLDHLRDGLSQAGRIASNLAALAVAALRRPARTDPASAPITSQSIPRPANPPVDAIAAETPARTPLCIVDFARDDWSRVAAEHGGTSNSLFIAITTALTVAAGRATWENEVELTIPMSRRGELDVDLRANSTTGLALAIPTDAARRKDLATIRELAKDIYQRSEAPNALQRLQPLIQSLSDATLLRLNKDAATPLAVASNIGKFNDTFARLGSEDVQSVALRSTPQRVSAEYLTRLRGGIAAWLNEFGDTVTLAVGSYDPTRISDDPTLAELVHTECRRWGLTPSDW